MAAIDVRSLAVDPNKIAEAVKYSRDGCQYIIMHPKTYEELKEAHNSLLYGGDGRGPIRIFGKLIALCEGLVPGYIEIV